MLLFMTLACNSNKVKAMEATLAFSIPSALGEGAFWNYKTQELLWIDIEKQYLYVYNPKLNTNKKIEMPSKIGTVVPSSLNNTVIVALADGIYKVDLVSHQLTQLSDIERTMTENRFNDGKCDPNGNLWVGSMHLNQDKPNANLYKIDADGIATEMIDQVTISNGIVWTKDGKIMYYIDTPTGVIKGYDFDVKNSTISNERVVVKVDPKHGFPDGMAIDENDNLWVGMWNGNAVAQFNPRSGKLLAKINVPAHNVTSCAFGGENLETLYITTASLDMNEEEEIKYKHAGAVFQVKPGVKGVRSTFFNE